MNKPSVGLQLQFEEEGESELHGEDETSTLKERRQLRFTKRRTVSLKGA